MAEPGFAIRLEARVKNDQLLKAREKLNLTHKDVAEAIGIAAQTYGTYERMQHYPSSETQSKIIEFYRLHGIVLNPEQVFPQQLREFQPKPKYMVVQTVPLAVLSQRDVKLLPLDGTIAEIEQTINQEQIGKHIESILSTTARRPRDADIMKMRFGLGEYKGQIYTFEQIAAKYKITRERVRQIETRALRRLRHPRYSRVIRQYTE